MPTPTQKGIERQQFSFREFVHGEPALGRGHTEDSHKQVLRRAADLRRLRDISSTWFLQEAA